ncbi:MAG: regulatory protein RecX [Lachnospiraceae bacterium]|nr:regulatory protein RecX [Lachnospiraceae bacterium]
MIITEIEKLKNRKNKVILDNGETIYLYNSELRKLGLDIDSNITEEMYELIMSEYIFARAKKKALAILERSINSKHQLRTKLKRADYNDNIIDKVMGFLEEYNFVDDYMYSKIYIEANSSRKSKLELKMELKKRGIDNDIIQSIFEEMSDDSEELAVRKFVRKYQDADGNIPDEKRMKALSALYRKGFNKDIIRKVIDVDYDY